MHSVQLGTIGLGIVLGMFFITALAVPAAELLPQDLLPFK